MATWWLVNKPSILFSPDKKKWEIPSHPLSPRFTVIFYGKSKVKAFATEMETSNMKKKLQSICVCVESQWSVQEKLCCHVILITIKEQ